MRAWNYLLRELGHDGFLDNGDSIIHPGEPAQAVFLHRKAFEKVDRVFNKASVLSKKKEKIGTWMNDNKISKDAKWYIEAESTKDTTGYHRPTYIRWESGTFINGVWKFGKWENGTWKNGVWEDGTWQDGIWENGTWKGGEFTGGVWEKGVFKGGGVVAVFGEGTVYGSSNDAIWLDGQWEVVSNTVGLFNKATWHDGIFDSPTSTFSDSVWKKGIFRNGVFEHSHWENGVFEGGKIVSDSTWSNGVFKGGVFENSLWVNGVWEGGTWKIAEIYSHKFEDYVDDSKINPAEFYEIEEEVDTIEELRERAQNP
jgi:hypothetical protein